MAISKAVDKFLKNIDSLNVGEVEITMPDGRVRTLGGRQEGPKADLEIRDWRVVPNLLARGDVAFLEDYKKGLWETKDLQRLLSLALINENAVGAYIHGNALSKLRDRLMYLFRANTLKGSQKNIHAHYDLGNAFYSLWLDPTMTYSSALYAGTEDLTTAQHNKYDRILNRFDTNPGKILEVGCGWGGFAERAGDRGAFVKGITISKEQHDFAKARLGEKAHIAYEDYRYQDEKFDNVVSIEMFEAVGESFWPVYFRKLAHVLKEKGKAVIQTITIADDRFEAYRKGSDAIRSYIFPGGMLPSPTRFEQEANKADLVQTDRFMFGQDYARTLEEWMRNFNAKEHEIKALGFDDAFMRIWRFYLASCIAGFRTGRIDVMQAEVMHG